MFRKVLFTLVFVGVVVVIGNITIVAQFAPIGGRVVTQSADGKQTGVANAVIDVYRIDIKGSFPSGKTDKNGNFAFAGVPLGGTFVLSISAPGFAPTVAPRIKAGNDKVLVVMSAGDGSKFTEDQVRQAMAGGGGQSSGGQQTAELTAEQKKQQAEYEAKKAEIEAKNAKAQKANEVVTASLKAGNEAYMAKNYDVAVAQYTQGVDADPDFVGTAPVLLNNRGAALIARATETYNAGVKNTDTQAMVAAKLKTREDLLAAIKGFMSAWTIMQKAPAADVTDKANFDASKLNTLRGTRDALRIAARTEQVDPAMIETAKVLMPEYVAVETDPAKKAEAAMIIADLYRVSGEYQAAADAYKKILETSPDNPDALAGAGLCLFALGAMNNNDKATLQEGANFLAKYVSVAPDGHKYKADVVAVLDQLKNEQKIAPQKVTTPAKKRGN